MSGKKRARTTIEDVAAMAGVSRQTVSRVLNRRGSVAAETRTAVLAAIKALDYLPNASARSLASRRSYVLGILSARLSDYTHARIIEGAEAEAREKGYLTFVSGTKHSPLGEPLSSPLLSQQHVEGVLIVYHGAQVDTRGIFKDIPLGLPIVTIGYAADHEGVVSCGIAGSEAARQATTHLLKLGHRRIAHITGPRDMFDSQERLLGYREALQEAAIPVDETLIAVGDWSSASGYHRTLELLERGSGFSGLFCQNDVMAMGALQALRERGIDVPTEVAVVGFDDIPLAPYSAPPLTTVHHPLLEIGQTSARVLIDLIEGRPPPARPILLEAGLVVRRSCGAPT